MRFDLISAIGLIAFLVFMGIFAFILQRYLAHKANSGHDIYLSDLDGPTYAVLVGALYKNLWNVRAQFDASDYDAQSQKNQVNAHMSLFNGMR